MTEYTDPFGLVGQVLDGQYRVDRLVGEGGFSAVYQGRHVGLDESIALKCMKIEMALGKEVVESFIHRFRDESRLLYRLSQGNLDIVRCMASGTAISPATGTMVPYMVLEWLEGRSLAADLHVRRDEGKSGRALFEALSLLDSAADGLAYAHTQGVIHRDLNPGNLYIAQTRTGPRMKVLDFGVAKVVRDEVLALGPRALTLANVRIFSPAYAAPEQFDERIGAVACSTDVWSLAVILSEVVTDRPVFDGDSLGAFFQKVLDPSYPRTPRQRGLVLGDAAEKVFQKALAMSPLARYPDVGVFWSELRLALSKDLGSSTVRGSNNPFQPAAMGTEVTQNARIEATGFDPSKISEVESTHVAPLPILPQMPQMQTEPAQVPIVPQMQTEPTQVAALVDGRMRPAEAEAARAAFTDLKGTVRMAGPLAPPTQESTLVMPPLQPLVQPHEVQPPLEATPLGTPITQRLMPQPLPLPEPSQQVPAVAKSSAGVTIAIAALVVIILAAAVGLIYWRTEEASDVSPSPSAFGSVAPSSAASVSTIEPSHATPSASVTAPPPSVSAVAPNPFDAKVARAALDTPASSIGACKARGAARGAGVADVTFSNDGNVTTVALEGTYASNKNEAACIIGKLKTAKMRSFDGAPQTIKYSFNISR